MNDQLLPIVGCIVKTERREFGYVLETQEGVDGIKVHVNWIKDKIKSRVPLGLVRAGFSPGMEVCHQAQHLGTASLGYGHVIRNRIVAGSEQVLVEFLASGERRWLPYQSLRWEKGARHRWLTGDLGSASSPERFRLKILAHAIDSWQEQTGALSKLEIDALPHQIHLVHHIINSDSLSWLIADDVGLGKTVETGMLIAALKHRNRAKRILIVTPAGLTRQWQDEMRYKFELDDFRLFGDQFTIEEPREWKMYDHVIASIDRLKDERHLEVIKQSEGWDLVIFDEAHRLSRRQYGMKLDSSQRYDLAKTLRAKTKAMILLSATPHQGKQDKFTSLLELLRPDRTDEIRLIDVNPEIIGDVIFRNAKSDVTDAEGNFIFKGKTVKTIPFRTSEEVQAFDRSLQRYLREGYEAGKRLGNKGNAIGFVMTVYRKLATSSVAAIHRALLRRKERILNGEFDQKERNEEWIVDDERYWGEAEENLRTSAAQFFEGELAILEELIQQCDRSRHHDLKLKGFMDGLLQEVLKKNPDEKLLIFTEYRATQQYLQEAIADRFGEAKVALIHGTMDQSERRSQIEEFEDTGQFLLSTEAGGEGINLQKACHIMVNFDLPWNPMRLVQRIGRLYRYGQQKRVVVFNVQTSDTLDEKIMSLMYERLDQVVTDMAPLGSEFGDGLHDDILGEMSDLFDVEDILAEAVTAGIDRTRERIDDALDRAKSSVEKHKDLFEHAEGFDPQRMAEKLVLDSEHIHAFVDGMFCELGVEIVERSHRNRVWSIRLNENQMQDMGTGRSRWKLTMDRLLASQNREVDLLDADHFLFNYLLCKAKAMDFNGQTASLWLSDSKVSALAAGHLAWQDEAGLRRNRELNLWSFGQNGRILQNDRSVLEQLKARFKYATPDIEKVARDAIYQQLETQAMQQLSSRSTSWQMPEHFELVACAAVAEPAGDLEPVEFTKR